MTTDTPDDIDLVGDAALVNGQALGEVGRLIDELAEKERKLEKAEKAVADLKAEIMALQTKALPDAMQSANVREFTTTSGEKVVLLDFIQVSIPSQSAIDKARGEEKQALESRRIHAHNWLQENGHGGLLKTDVVVSFGKDKEDEVTKLLGILKAAQVQPTVEQSVHSATLSSWAKEQKDAGKIPPEDIFGTYVGVVAKRVVPRKKRK